MGTLKAAIWWFSVLSVHVFPACSSAGICLLADWKSIFIYNSLLSAVARSGWPMERGSPYLPPAPGLCVSRWKAHSLLSLSSESQDIRSVETPGLSHSDCGGTCAVYSSFKAIEMADCPRVLSSSFPSCVLVHRPLSMSRSPLGEQRLFTTFGILLSRLWHQTPVSSSWFLKVEGLWRL